MTKTVSALLACTAALASPAIRLRARRVCRDIAALQAQIQAHAGATRQAASRPDRGAPAAARRSGTPFKAVARSVNRWFANTTISGKAFFNVSNIDQKSRRRGTRRQNGTQTELKRFYIGVDHKFNDIFSANLTTDFRYNTNGTSKDTLVYVKKAYVQAKLSRSCSSASARPTCRGFRSSRASTAIASSRTRSSTAPSSAPRPTGACTSAELRQRPGQLRGLGDQRRRLQDAVAQLEHDRPRRPFSVNPIKNITLAVGGYTGKLGKSADNAGSATPHRATRFNALAAYTDSASGPASNISRPRTGTTYHRGARDKSDGWSVFGSFAFTPQVRAFGRYDWVKPSKDINPGAEGPLFQRRRRLQADRARRPRAGLQARPGSERLHSRRPTARSAELDSRHL